MDRVEYVLSMLDLALDTKEKRHMIGGILLSVSFLCIGLALTVMSLKTGEVKNE